MKLHKSQLMKWLSAAHLTGCIAIKWYFNDPAELPMEYFWPVHVLTIGIGFVMVFGMMNDQKEIESAIREKLGEQSTLNKIRNRLLSGLISFPVLLITLLPAFGIMGGSLNEASVGEEGFLMFVNGWLLFSIAIFSYFTVAQPAVNQIHRKLCNSGAH